MSGVVEDAERKREWEAYQGFLQQLVEYGDIKDKDAEGITKLVIAKGLDALSDKQSYVFKTKVQDNFAQPRCEQCEDLIPWDQAYEHVHSPGRCASCQHSYDKFMAKD